MLNLSLSQLQLASVAIRTAFIEPHTSIHDAHSRERAYTLLSLLLGIICLYAFIYFEKITPVAVNGIILFSSIFSYAINAVALVAITAIYLPSRTRHTAMATVLTVSTSVGIKVVSALNNYLRPLILASIMVDVIVAGLILPIHLSTGTGLGVLAAIPFIDLPDDPSIRYLVGLLTVVVMSIVAVRIAHVIRQTNVRMIQDSSREPCKDQCFFRSLVENSSDPVIVVGSDSRIVYATPPTQCILGYSPRNMVGRSISDFIHPHDVEAVARQIDNLLREGETGRVPSQFRVRQQDGTWKTLQGSATVIQAPNLTGILFNSYDVTERLRVEEAAIALENAPLVSETRRRIQQQESVCEIAGVLNASQDVHDVFPVLARQLRRITNAEQVSITLLDNVQEDFLVWNIDPECTSLGLGTRYATNATSAGSDILAGRIHFTPDLSVEREQRVERELYNAGFRSRVSIPLQTCSGTLGALNLSSSQAEAFGQNEVPMLEQIAQSLAIAIERMQLLDAKQKQYTELTKLFDFSQVLLDSGNDLPAILALIPESAIQIMQVRFARLAIPQHDTWVMVEIFQQGMGKVAGEHEVFPLCSGFLRALEQGQIMLLDSEDPTLSTVARETLFFGVAKIVCLVPLRTKERLEGILILGETPSEAEKPFTTEKLGLARNIANQAASAIHRATLHTEVADRMRQMTLLSTLALRLAEARSQKDAFEQLAKIVPDLFPGTNTLLISLYDEQRQTIIGAYGCVAGQLLHDICWLSTSFDPTGTEPRSAAILRHQPVIINEENEQTPPSLVWSPESEDGILPKSALYVPIMVRHKPLGVIQLSSHVSHRFVSTDAELLFLVANTIGIATENAGLLEDLLLSNAEISNAYDTTLTGWSRALDLKDAQTEGHAQRVVNLTLAMARAFGVPNEELVHIRRGALLHDIGKMAIPDHILLKPGTLTPDEWNVMRKHPAYAIELLGPISYLRPALDIPYCHHEKWDGTGYPQGLAGEEIPLAARIFAIADVWDALTYDRPYRKAWSKERARKHIEQLAGSHFDPQVVQCFLSLSKDANPADSDQVLALVRATENEMCQVTE